MLFKKIVPKTKELKSWHCLSRLSLDITPSHLFHAWRSQAVCSQLFIILFMSSFQHLDSGPLLFLSVLGLHSNDLRVHLTLLSWSTYPAYFHSSVIIRDITSVTILWRISSFLILSLRLISSMALSIRLCVILCLFAVIRVHVSASHQNRKHVLVDCLSLYANRDIEMKQ